MGHQPGLRRRRIRVHFLGHKGLTHHHTSGNHTPVVMRRLTRTCQMFSVAPSNEQNFIETPSSPWPPHMLLGVMKISAVEKQRLLLSFLMLAHRRASRASSLGIVDSYGDLLVNILLQNLLQHIILLILSRGGE